MQPFRCAVNKKSILPFLITSAGAHFFRCCYLIIESDEECGYHLLDVVYDAFLLSLEA